VRGLGLSRLVLGERVLSRVFVERQGIIDVLLLYVGVMNCGDSVSGETDTATYQCCEAL
jgi:hypothetical protein